ncbi:DUF2269 family protein [Rossellomorea aquimaris]|jgi:uncharacterized membrane protein|uniref:DUF2269 family protein n=1 Tax=Rossellomorea aquimaris TaxID=189382 RepID=A0A1J6VWZ7_9BACI|nr:DUF2269 family protein [Rossellomorea aquimaris]OIU70374.1 hypothetical protein BHE18_11680 [Rossellomorea aquimaris]
MSIYSILVLIHVVAAVAGLGASFAMPVVMKTPETAHQAKFSLDLSKNIENFAKVGSIVLLITGLVMGFMNPYLFKTGWYIGSIAIYIGVQFIVAGIMPKKVKQMAEIIHAHKGEDVPAAYGKINAELKPYNIIIHSAAIILIILMSIKPF